MTGVVKKLKVREKRDRGLKTLVGKIAPAVKAWYDQSVIQYLKEHRETMTEEQEELILDLSDFIESKLEDPSKL